MIRGKRDANAYASHSTASVSARDIISVSASVASSSVTAAQASASSSASSAIASAQTSASLAIASAVSSAQNSASVAIGLAQSSVCDSPSYHTDITKTDKPISGQRLDTIREQCTYLCTAVSELSGRKRDFRGAKC